MSARLDFTDEAAVRAWLAYVVKHFGDVDALVRDMLRPPARRELGPVLHAANYSEARKAIMDALAYAGAVDDDDDGGGEPDEDDAPPWETRANGSAP